MPYSVQVQNPAELSPTDVNVSEELVDHPLSPVQEHATEAIVTQFYLKFYNNN